MQRSPIPEAARTEVRGSPGEVRGSPGEVRGAPGFRSRACSPGLFADHHRTSTAHALIGGLLLVGLMSLACRPAAESAAGATAGKDQPPPQELLVFPDDMRVEDETVNAFVERSMKVCAAGDYDRFRLLWSAREEPIARSEYDRGWQAVREIRVNALQPVILGADPDHDRDHDEQVYVLLATVSMDPDHPAARDKPIRDVVLMLIDEQDSWRLASAPSPMRAWVKQLVKEGKRQQAQGNRQHG